MNSLDTAAKANRQFYPSIFILALASHFLYYYTVFTGVYPRPLYLVLIALAALALGYWAGSRETGRAPRESSLPELPDAGLLQKGAFALIAIGMAAHLYYYWKNPFTSYGESYSTAKGQGYITAFFNFWLLGMMLLEYLSVEGKNAPWLKWGNRLLMAAYSVLYLAVFLKRRQILLLYIPLMAVWGRRMRSRTKLLAWIGGIAAALLMMLYGRARYHMDNSSFAYTLERIAANFTWEWLTPVDFEGKYISRTLNDVLHYVQEHGHETGIFKGILLCMVPGVLLGGNKPMAFPAWYSSHFYPETFARGVSFAGSTVGELYLLGGIPLLVLGYLLLGFLCAKMQRLFHKSRQTWAVLLYARFIYTIVFLPRFDLASLLIEFVFLDLPLLTVCKFIPQWKKKE